MYSLDDEGAGDVDDDNVDDCFARNADKEIIQLLCIFL